MALINELNQYIIIQADGNFIVFDSKKDYSIYTNDILYNQIIDSYKQLLEKYKITVEQLYYDPNAASIHEFEAIEQEYIMYMFNREHSITKAKYPIFKKYFPKIAIQASISKIVSKGKYNWNFKTVQEAEQYAIQYEVFGKAHSC